MKRIISALLLVSMLSACQQGGGGNMFVREDGGVSKGGLGTLAGAGLGALVGSKVGKGNGQLVGVALGTILGAGLGNSIGTSLDRADMAKANQASQNAFESAPSGQQIAWQNPDSGNSGTITPMRTYQEPNTGQYCREYNQTITVGGKTEQAYGKACRQIDGTWKVQS